MRAAPDPNQGKLDLGPVNMRQFAPVAKAQQGAVDFTGGKYNPKGLENTMADRPRAHQIQRAVTQALASPTEGPGIRESFGAMRDDVNKQYEYMTKPTEQGGMGMTHETTEHDPYKTAGDMAADVQGGHIKTFATASTGHHAVFSDEENDKFRAVHDVFGHAATGRGFSRNGEEAAYLSHRQMFSRKAGQAMASETRGQNSYLNYGPTHDFPDQGSKLIAVPKVATQVTRRR